MFVGVDETRFAAPDGHRHGRDLLGQAAGRDGLGRALLRPQRERVLVRAGHVALLGDVLRRLAHRVDAVAAFHLRVHEPPAQGGVVHRDRPVVRRLRLRHDEWGAAHALHAARDDEIRLAGPDGPRRDRDGVRSRPAEPVDGAARHRLGQAGEQQRHPRDVAVVLAGLVRATEDDVVDGGPVDRRQPGRQLAEHVRGEVVGSHCGQRAAVPADRGADPCDEVGLGRCRRGGHACSSGNGTRVPAMVRLRPRSSATTVPSALRTATS